MSLEPAHEWIARVALGLPEAAHLALAGGGAMLAHGLVERPTRDVDLFTPVEVEVDPLVGALTEALRDRGGEVDVERRGATFARLIVTTPDGTAVAVEIGQDARIRSTVQLSFGRVLHPDEVAADKVLALFGRAAARDLVDVAALRDRYSLEQLCQLASEKDPGFDTHILAYAVHAAAAQPEAAFEELGLSPEAVRTLRATAEEWRAVLLRLDHADPSRPPPAPPDHDLGSPGRRQGYESPPPQRHEGPELC